MDGAVPFAWRSPTKLPGGSQPRPFLLLRLWPRRDVIRFAELYHQVKFPQALVLLRQGRGAEPLLHEVARFYHMQLHRHSEGVAYLYQRGVRCWALIELMRVGYAPGGCLRGWLTQLGYALPALRGRAYDRCRLRRIHSSCCLSVGWPR